jgi:ubiquinone/menaquinone biosynthesis C-methylase UbiE
LFFNPTLLKSTLKYEQMSTFRLLFIKSRGQNVAIADNIGTRKRREDVMTNMIDKNVAPNTIGLVLHWAARYDLLVWLATFGRERAFREKILSLARLEPGESVLDVGCGTGTLAIAAKRYVGPTGKVCGIDASLEMLARADKKARKAGTDIVLKNGAAQALPFPDAQFNIVLSTMMLHHLPSNARQQCVCEIRRVLKPGGRVLAVDFGSHVREKRGFFAHFHRHGHVNLPDIIALFNEAGLNIIESGAVGMLDLQFVLAMAPRQQVITGIATNRPKA